MKKEDIEHMIKKIELNSYYYVHANDYFIMFDPDIADKITAEGQKNLNIFDKELYKTHGK